MQTFFSKSRIRAQCPVTTSQCCTWAVNGTWVFAVPVSRNAAPFCAGVQTGWRERMQLLCLKREIPLASIEHPRYRKNTFARNISLIVWPATRAGKVNQNVRCDFYPSGQDGTILPARDCPLCPARKIFPKAIS